MTATLAQPGRSRPAARPAVAADPVLEVLSLGAGQQSSALLLLSALGEVRVPRFQVAVFADTGWEPPAVYGHLDRLTTIATTVGIEVVRVSAGDIRADSLDPAHRFVSLPLYTLSPDGRRGIARRQCTHEYKVRPILAEIRARLGYPHPRPVPAGVWARLSLGISTEELLRARDSRVRYARHAFPLLDLGWRREDCVRLLAEHNLADTPRSSCVGCPFHTDTDWWRLQHTDPTGWAQAVAFDHAIRRGAPGARAGRGTFYLHPSRRPLDEVTLRPRPDRVASPGCSPFTCPRGEVA